MRTPSLLIPALVTFSFGRLAVDPTPPLTPDIPAKFTPPNAAADFERREVMIAMRDGVKLHTVILVPKGAKRAPIILTRTPYNATKRAARSVSISLAASLPVSDDQIAD